jgi:hypothetical protein
LATWENSKSLKIVDAIPLKSLVNFSGINLSRKKKENGECSMS